MQRHRRVHLSHDEIERRRERATAVLVAQGKAGDEGRKDQMFDFGVAAGDGGEPVEVPSEEKQVYICADCQGEIVQDQSNCQSCGVKLNWEGISDAT